MSYPILAPDTEPCVWMSAGVIRYHLCDRGLECERCLLDAALRAAHPRTATPGAHPRIGGAVPRDRLYAPGHTWLKRHGRGAAWRVGLDAFAVALLDETVTVGWDPGQERLVRGEPFGRLELGDRRVALAAPVDGRLVRRNQGLLDDTLLLLAHPYDQGWMAEVIPEPAHLHDLAAPATACRALGSDLGRYREALALGLLTDGHGPPLARSGCRGRLTCVRAILGDDRYASLLEDLLHQPSEC